MGSRGAFEDINMKNFTSVDGGQTFNSIGEVDGVRVHLFFCHRIS